MGRGYDAAAIRRSCAKAGITDTVIARRRKPGEPKPASPPVGMGLRWPVERTNSWLSGFAQMRRNTDRSPRHRHAQLALAAALILTVKLLKWATRWSPPAAAR